MRLPDEPAVAEVAVTVADHYQGRGLGTLLLALVARSAIENGIATLRHYVLAENQSMLGVLADLPVTRVPAGAGVYRVDVALPADPDRIAVRAP
ncbi:MAG: GNAT family N-acetyltransferase [Egibacteraceae bacterium]